jgi:cleavage and polyadenylation specificity factor subunit 3
MDEFDDMGPCVVMASPGMMQSGLSRELFESWCTDKKSGVIIAGYCVEGTLAKVKTNVFSKIQPLEIVLICFF